MNLADSLGFSRNRRDADECIGGGAADFFRIRRWQISEHKNHQRGGVRL
jgi:hypothetical protein